MALVPSTRYSGQVETGDVDYPHGKARNAGAFQDGTGTPLEKDWLNDDWGFKQALLDAASIAPSGSPDKVGASQYLTALDTIIAAAIAATGLKYASCTPAGTSEQTGANFQLLMDSQSGGYTIDSLYRLLVPTPGLYFMLVTGGFRSASVANPTSVGVNIRNLGAASGTRFSASTSHVVNVSHMGVRNMVPGEFIAVGSSGAVLTADSAKLFAVKIG